MNKDYDLVSHMDEDRLKAFIDKADDDNRRLMSMVSTNLTLQAMARHRMLGLQLENAEVE